jgi:TonB family protein
VSTTPATRNATSTREPEHSQSTGSSRDDDASSLEITRNVRAPLPTVNIPGSDSISRIAQAKVGTDGFSKQFWNALDKKPEADAGSPKNAKLIGDMPQPYYPEFLRKNGVDGEVVVQFTVDQNGRPDLSTFEAVRSPHDALTNSVRKVVERMRFEPALTGGAKPQPRTEVVQSSFVFAASAK